jgi:large subunit ribosomal protein L3
MKIGIIGRKLGMMQIFDENGIYIPVTAIQIEDCVITEIKSILTHGYNSVQLGCFKINPKKLLKPQLGYFIKKKIQSLSYLKEFKIQNIRETYIGKKIDITQFSLNQKINIQALTIGKGNCGNIKRNNFKRGPMTHGSKHHRLQGSLGAGTTPSRVFPGKKMAGRLGRQYSTIKSLIIVYLDISKNIFFVKGSIPGKIGNIVHIKHN